jgi:hypothetical protein
LVYSENLGPAERVRDFIDSRKEITNWHRWLPNSFFLVSELPATKLTDLFRTYTKDKGHFIILDTATDRDGWLPRRAWKLMRYPRAVGEPFPE